jgi:hypothetical protein
MGRYQVRFVVRLVALLMVTIGATGAIVAAPDLALAFEFCVLGYAGVLLHAAAVVVR